MSVNLAQIIRARRVVRGMGRQDLASAVGCDVRTVRRWECGSRPLTRHMPALREALGISLEEMDRIMLSMLRNGGQQLRIEGPEFLEARGLSHRWLAATLLAMDRRLIDDEPTFGVHDPDKWAPVFEALPDSWRLLTYRSEIVGNWQFVPLAPGLHDESRAGRLNDSDIRLDHLATLDLPGKFDINITALVLETAYRHGKGLMMLLRSLCERFCHLAICGIHIRRIDAVPWIPRSVLLCRRSRMEPVRTIKNRHSVFFEAAVEALTDPLSLPEYARLKAIHEISVPSSPLVLSSRGSGAGCQPQ